MSIPQKNTGDWSLEETDIAYISLLLILIIIIIKRLALKQSCFQKGIGIFLDLVLVCLPGHCDMWEEEFVMFTASFATAKI